MSRTNSEKEKNYIFGAVKGYDLVEKSRFQKAHL